ncbi:hypothetical protein SHKM778_18750 [Streptomyces sp. KM77-8]|uniref:Uncharacterized protein n=1 Tax=Streptomyces haneummycinicus TaxID=3074435 RepID=A0AAT9HDK2_9ACTN
MRDADPVLRGAGPFSLDLFERAARELRATEHGLVDDELTPGAYRELLTRAADTLRRDPAAVLTDLVTLPHVTLVAEGIAGIPEQDVNDEAARILGLDPYTAAIGRPERAELFWATVKALEWESRTPTRTPSRPACSTWTSRTRPCGPTCSSWSPVRRRPVWTWEAWLNWAPSTWSCWAPSPREPAVRRPGEPAGRHWAPGTAGHSVDVHSAVVMAATPTAAIAPCAGRRCRGPPTPPGPPRTWCGARAGPTTSA